MQLKESPDAFLATIQIGITLVGTLASAVGGATAVEALTPVFANLGLGQASQPAALGAMILAITYVSLVLGELVPKAIALRDSERIATFVARPIFWLSRVSGGLVRVLTVSTNAVLRVAGLGAAARSPFISEEEVRYLVREGAAKGIFEKTEEELVHNVFEFADTTVREVMVPRPSIQGMGVATPADEVLPRAAAVGHSRIPVYRDDIDNPVGVLVLEDLIRALADGRRPPLPALVRPTLFVPERAKISAVLRDFQRNRHDLALVVDEYGAVVGLITIEDIVQEIVGAIPDDRAPETEGRVTRLPDGSLLVDGLASVYELHAAGIAVEESRD
jgi:putative hemolysin